MRRRSTRFSRADGAGRERHRKFAMDILKVDGTPTFFINGEVIVGEAPFEDFEKKIEPLLKS